MDNPLVYGSQGSVHHVKHVPAALLQINLRGLGSGQAMKRGLHPYCARLPREGSGLVGVYSELAKGKGCLRLPIGINPTHGGGSCSARADTFRFAPKYNPL